MKQVDLSNFSVGRIKLGSKTELHDGNHEDESVSFHVDNGVVTCINVRLCEFYSEGEIFEGSLVFNDKCLSLISSVQPSQVEILINSLSKQWDDGVEVNYQCRLNNVNLEFSWQLCII